MEVPDRLFEAMMQIPSSSSRTLTSDEVTAYFPYYPPSIDEWLISVCGGWQERSHLAAERCRETAVMNERLRALEQQR
jgi:hypothetical protein